MKTTAKAIITIELITNEAWRTDVPMSIVLDKAKSEAQETIERALSCARILETKIETISILED